MSRIIELLTKQFLNADELEEIDESNYIKRVEFNGNSGIYYDWKWFTVFMKNKEYDVYVKY